MKKIFLLLILSFFYSFVSFSSDRNKGDSLLKLYREAYYPEQKIYFLQQAIYVINRESPDRALFLCNELLQLSQKSGSEKLLVQAYEVLGDIYQINNDLNNAKEYYGKALRLIEGKVNQYDTLYFNISQNLANVYIQLKDYNTATEILQKAIEKLKLVNVNLAVELMLEKADIIANYQLRLDIALKSISDALLIADTTHNNYLKYKIRRQLALIYYSNEQYDKAKKYFYGALDIAKRLNEPLLEMDVYIYLSDIYIEDKDTLMAMDILSKLFPYEKVYPNEPKLLYALGLYFELLGENERATKYYTRALKLFEREENYRWAAYLYSVIAKNYAKYAPVQKAASFAIKGAYMAEEYKLPKEMMDNYKVLSSLYELQSNYQKANEYFIRYKKIEDSLMNDEAKRNMAYFQAELEKKSSEAELELIKKEKELIKAKEKQLLIIAITTAIILIIISLFAYFLYKNNKEKTEINKELENQARLLYDLNRELEELSIVARQTDNCVIITDSEDKITWVNESFTRITGYEPDEVIGKRPGEILRPKDKSFYKELENMLNKKEPFRTEVLNVSKDGREIWISINVTPIVNDQGVVEKYISIGADITKKKIFEIELQKYAEKQGLINDINTAVLQSSSTQEIIDRSLKKIINKFNTARASLSLFNFEENFFTYVAYQIDKDTSEVKKTTKYEPMEYFGNYKTIMEGKRVVENDLLSRANRSKSDVELVEEGIKSYIMLPLSFDNQAYGSLNVASFEKNFFNVEVQGILMEIAQSLSILLHQTRLKEQLEYTNKVVIQKNKNIVDSINYAKRIQSAMLPKEEYLKQLFPEIFVLSLPKDIVSGDFYWAEQNSGKAFLSVVDCTGHGVPGAMMSIIGYNLLNQAINEKSFQHPSQILNFLNLGVHLMLDSGADEDISDGMDLSMIAYHKATQTLEYSGAFNPIYIVRKKELFEYKGERCSIGERMSSIHFNDQKIQLQVGDMVYLFSDGYADQFGGKEDKKYKYHNFKKLLISVSHLPVEEQKEKLFKEYERWKGEHPQTDDICIVGFKIT